MKVSFQVLGISSTSTEKNPPLNLVVLSWGSASNRLPALLDYLVFAKNSGAFLKKNRPY